MGLLDQYIDPEVMAQVKAMNQPSEEERRNARNNALMQAGFSMMMNNGGRSKSEALFNALGSGGMAGMGAYQGSLDESRQRNQNELQQGLMFNKMAQEMQQRKAQQAAIAGLPQEDQQAIAAGVPYKDIYTERNKPYTLSQGDKRFGPGGTMIAEVAPKLPDGMEVGPDGSLRFIPSYLSGKKEIASAGKPTIENRIYNTAETEQAKVWGKTLGELRSNIASNAFTAPSKLSQLDRMEKLLQGVDGGNLAPVGLEIASAAKSLGFSIDPKLGNKEAAEALSREIAGSFRQPGTGPMTDKDFDNFLKRVPDLSKSAEGRNQIFKTMRASLNRDIEANKLVSSYAKRRNGNIDDGISEELANFYAGNPVVEQQPDKSGGFKIIGVR